MGQRTALLIAGATLLACSGSGASTTTETPIASTAPPPATTAAPTPSPPSTAPATTSPPTTAAIREGLSFEPGALEAGVYATSSFLIPFIVELPSGWYSSGENPLQIGFAFGHEVMGQVGGGADPSAIYLFSRFADQDIGAALEEIMSTSFNLEWTEVIPIEVAGYGGADVEGANQGATYTLPALLGSGQLYQAAGEFRQVRISALDVGGKTLIVVAEAQREEFEEIIQQRGELLELLEFSG